MTHTDGLMMGLGAGVGGAIGGAVSGIAAGTTEDEYISKNGVKDPAIKIADELADYLSSGLAMKSTGHGNRLTKATSSKQLAAEYAGAADCLLDVQTVLWTCMYIPFDFGKYQIMYGSKLRLIDISTKKTLAEKTYV
jgi:hypothetical protein